MHQNLASREALEKQLSDLQVTPEDIISDDGNTSLVIAIEERWQKLAAEHLKLVDELKFCRLQIDRNLKLADTAEYEFDQITATLRDINGHRNRIRDRLHELAQQRAQLLATPNELEQLAKQVDSERSEHDQLHEAVTRDYDDLRRKIYNHENEILRVNKLTEDLKHRTDAYDEKNALLVKREEDYFAAYTNYCMWMSNFDYFDTEA